MCSEHQRACGVQVGLLLAQNYPPCDACLWPPHLASGSHPGSCCLTHMLSHLSQSKGNWELGDLPTQTGSSLHPPKLPCPEPTCRTSASMGDLKCQSNLPRLLISLLSLLLKQVEICVKLLISFELPICAEMSCDCRGSACAACCYSVLAKAPLLETGQVVQEERCSPKGAVFSTRNFTF